MQSTIVAQGPMVQISRRVRANMRSPSASEVGLAVLADAQASKHLDQKKIQDATAALIQYIPSLIYVVVGLVYVPLMFVVREPLLLPIWIAFSVHLVCGMDCFGFPYFDCIPSAQGR